MLQRILIALALAACLATPAFAGYDEGKRAYDNRDWARAITTLRPLAEAGDDRAMMLIGNMYSEGRGVIRSYKEAFSLYRRAAVQKNNPQAMALLGVMYTSGLGTVQNRNTALQWLRRAAELGDQRAAFFCATVLFEGNKSATDDIQPDIHAAYRWYRIAAKETEYPQFSESAKNVADRIAARAAELRLTPEQIAAADKEAAEWKPADAKTLGPPPEEPPVKAALPKASAPSPESPDKSPPPPDPSPK